MIPETFEQWLDCIQKDCKIELTNQFCEKRLLELNDPNNKGSKSFKNKYGVTHFNNVKMWFEQKLLIR
jgi:hypothetical protein